MVLSYHFCVAYAFPAIARDMVLSRVIVCKLLCILVWRFILRGFGERKTACRKFFNAIHCFTISMTFTISLMVCKHFPNCQRIEAGVSSLSNWCRSSWTVVWRMRSHHLAWKPHIYRAVKAKSVAKLIINQKTSSYLYKKNRDEWLKKTKRSIMFPIVDTFLSEREEKASPASPPTPLRRERGVVCSR